jgi:uncharacterized protein
MRSAPAPVPVPSRGIYLEITLAQEIFFLLHQRALFRPSKKQLILSDLHLGKASHFRKQGLAIPAHSHLNDLERLAFLIRAWEPHAVLLLGDLFHSDYNREWLWFKGLLKEHQKVEFILVMGNHDILPESAYAEPNLQRCDEMEEDYLVFTHEPLPQPGRLNICGHVHPGLEIRGQARQSFRLPCFYSGNSQLILPAFGELTGLYLLDKKENSDYYLITRDTIVKV